MMGRTHAVGGVAAAAAFATLTGTIPSTPVWCYALAAVAALVPDADNGPSGMIHSRLYLRPVKWATMPLWAGASHRTRSHSLAAAAGFGAILYGLIVLLAFLATAAGASLALPVGPIVAAGVAGYLSHIILDMLNTKPVELLWPLPLGFFFPPWEWGALGILPGRFRTQSWQEHWLVATPLAAGIGWFAFEHIDGLGRSLSHDSTLGDLAGFAVKAVETALHLIGKMLG